MPRRRQVSNQELIRWQVERERFQIDASLPPAPFQVFTPEQLVPKILKKAGLSNVAREHTLVAEWESLVGNSVARHTRPGKLERCILYVYVSNSAWLVELRNLGEAALLKNVQQRMGRGAVKGIRLQLDPDPPQKPANRQGC